MLLFASSPESVFYVWRATIPQIGDRATLSTNKSSRLQPMEILLAILASSVFAMATFVLGIFVGAHFVKMTEERAMLTMAEPEMLQILSSPELVMTKSGRLIHLKSVACRWAKDQVGVEPLKMCSQCFRETSKVKVK